MPIKDSDVIFLKEIFQEMDIVSHHACEFPDGRGLWAYLDPRGAFLCIARSEEERLPATWSSRGA